ncbi:hypothetical protein GGTG_00898 [Gaeumannomyces tritici R3-111a-1]|uniref:Uncharacterized protein n=1 Tax=Gaeumannomyces tritici (strain R3-111a-1) TaxID=644352 RepID=J3NI13_GAET3|nr:hypothetical protein GGTG_00898 [Gaeumannomyces tritici R3-111a-1]EJT80906.1 hypothetical protein GGTG_00898 [Gaeumannomyces tritici R3-111a-1]
MSYQGDRSGGINGANADDDWMNQFVNLDELVADFGDTVQPPPPAAPPQPPVNPRVRQPPDIHHQPQEDVVPVLNDGPFPAASQAQPQVTEVSAHNPVLGEVEAGEYQPREMMATPVIDQPQEIVATAIEQPQYMAAPNIDLMPPQVPAGEYYEPQEMAAPPVDPLLFEDEANVYQPHGMSAPAIDPTLFRAGSQTQPQESPSIQPGANSVQNDLQALQPLVEFIDLTQDDIIDNTQDEPQHYPVAAPPPPAAPANGEGPSNIGYPVEVISGSTPGAMGMQPRATGGGAFDNQLPEPAPRVVGYGVQHVEITASRPARRSGQAVAQASNVNPGQGQPPLPPASQLGRPGTSHLSAVPNQTAGTGPHFDVEQGILGIYEVNHTPYQPRMPPRSIVSPTIASPVTWPANKGHQP